MSIRLKAKATKVFRQNQNARTRYICNEGGARSSKTYSIAQKYILKLLKERGKTLTIARKTTPALKSTVMRDFFDILKSWNLYSPENHNKSDKTYVLFGNLIEFISMDDADKKRGAKRDYLWLNEATEFTYEDFIQLDMRTVSEVTLDYNPSFDIHWIYDKVIGRRECTLLKSTYRDNPFLPKELVRVIESLREDDPEYWTVYGLGERAVSTTKIYTRWDIVPEMPESYDDIVYGLDFGYVNPSALIEIRVKDLDAYIRESIYKTRLTNSQLIEEMERVIPADHRDKYIIKADSAEPARIEEISDAGFLIVPTKKGPGSVRTGIDRVKRFNLHVTADSVNVRKEIAGYKWKQDRNGNIIDGEPVKFMDHAMNALAYGLGMDGAEERFESVEIVDDVEAGAEIERVEIGDY